MIKKLFWPIVRVLQFLSYTHQIIKKVDNWKDYYIDVFTELNKHDFWIMKVGDIKLKLRTKSVDRWSALENLVLDENRLYEIIDRDFETIIDLGANIGASVLSLYRAFPKANIIAIEPNHNNTKLLKDNVALNGVQNKVRILRKAQVFCVGRQYAFSGSCGSYQR